jgi:hypothetical protein
MLSINGNLMAFSASCIKKERSPEMDLRDLGVK